jgi:phosphoglycolate phosphatase
MHSRPSHILFDLDGTLADSSQGILWSFAATLEKIGLHVDEAVLLGLIGPPLGESFSILGVPDEKIDQVVALYRAFYAERGIYEARLYDGVATTLEELSSQGVRLGVATAKRIDFAQQMLSALGVAHLFDQICGASVDLHVTSKYDIMALVMQSWTFSPDLDVWMVGDRHYDMVAARTHDIRAVGALWGFGSAEELLDAGAHWLISRPHELLDIDDVGGAGPCLANDVCDECGVIRDESHPSSCGEAQSD